MVMELTMVRTTFWSSWASPSPKKKKFRNNNWGLPACDGSVCCTAEHLNFRTSTRRGQSDVFRRAPRAAAIAASDRRAYERRESWPKTTGQDLSRIEILWNKEGNIHTQNPNVAWEKETSKQLRKHGSKSSLTFYEKEDLKDVVKSCEITHDRNKPLI
jgi:hypothetical protein